MKKKRVVLSSIKGSDIIKGMVKNDLVCLSKDKTITDYNDAIKHMIAAARNHKKLLLSDEKVVHYNEHIEGEFTVIDMVIADTNTGQIKNIYRLFIDENDYVEVIEELKKTEPEKTTVRIILFKSAEEAREYTDNRIKMAGYEVDKDKSSDTEIYARYKSSVRKFTIVK